LSSLVFHVDIDAFFASVEQIDHPEYGGKPVIVGAQPGHRGVVSTCSYEARRFGIHSAMPISRAYELCPQGIFLSPRMGRYRELSRAVMDIFSSFSPDVRPISVDEAFLDMTGTERLFGPPREAALLLKQRVKEGTRLSVSVGAAPNRYVAKMASARSKPDGLVVVDPGGEAAFVAALPLDKLWGVGEKTREHLASLGITSIAALASLTRSQLQTMLGQGSGDFLYMAVRGQDPGIFSDEPKSRSMSTETTFEHDVIDWDTLDAVVLAMSHELADRLVQEGLTSKTVQIKLRYDDFTTIVGRETLPRRISCANDIRTAALSILGRKRDPSRPVRLLGVGVASVEGGGEPEQGELFMENDERRTKVEKAVLDLKNTKGVSLVKARLLGTPRDSRS